MPRTITLRDIPADIERFLEHRSAEQGTSLNKTVIKLLSVAVKVADRPAHGAPYDDLDELLGTWSKSQADEFDSALSDTRLVDPEQWE